MKIELSKEEALVLSDWLNQNRENNDKYFDDAVKCVFWSIECELERELVEPFYENYTEIVEQAKETVKQNYGI